MTRGPDFLPYPMPAPAAAPAVVAVEAVETRSRWDLALAGLTEWGVAAVTGGLVALLSLLLVSLLAGHRATGAGLAVLGAVVAVAAGLQALRSDLPVDSAALVRSGQGTGVVSAVLALLLLLLVRPADAQPPVQIPQPLPSPSATQQLVPSPTPEPSTGSPSPRTDVLPPGTLPGFGIPTQPDAPLTEPSTDMGTLTGVVVDAAGKPVVGATIVIERSTQGDTSDSPRCPVRTTARTDSKGVYTVGLCQLGPDLGYKVTITAGGAVASTELYVNAGRTTRYDVILALRTS